MTFTCGGHGKAVRPDIKIILGGPGVSFTADEILNRCHAVDYVVQGEGEEAFINSLAELTNGKDGLCQRKLLAFVDAIFLANLWALLRP